MATRILNIPTRNVIDSPFQGRFFKGEDLKMPYIKKQLEELKTSIENTGLLQPITVRPSGDNYELIDGHRRLEAYRQLGKGNIPAIIKEADDKDTQVMSVVANLQRSNLSNLERALAFEKILKAGVFKNKKELSRSIGKDETYVGDLMNLLNMDKRILSHLAKFNPNADVRALRIIRKSGTTNENGKSDAQNKLYLKYVHQKLSREQLQNAVQKEQDKLTTSSEMQQVAVKNSVKGFRIDVNEKLNKSQKEHLARLLEEKLKESLREVLESTENE